MRGYIPYVVLGVAAGLFFGVLLGWAATALAATGTPQRVGARLAASVAAGQPTARVEAACRAFANPALSRYTCTLTICHQRRTAEQEWVVTARINGITNRWEFWRAKRVS